MTNYQQREHDDERCSHPKCRASSEIIYLQGATNLNPDYGVQLCSKHEESFSREWLVAPSGFATHTPAPVLDAEPEVKRVPTVIDLEGMWI